MRAGEEKSNPQLLLGQKKAIETDSLKSSLKSSEGASSSLCPLILKPSGLAKPPPTPVLGTEPRLTRRCYIPG